MPNTWDKRPDGTNTIKTRKELFGRTVPRPQNRPVDNLRTSPQATITAPKTPDFLARTKRQKSVMDPKPEYAKTGGQILDFVKNEFGPDVGKELMANAGGNVEFIGRIFHDEQMQKAGQRAEDYWQAKQTQTWKDMNPTQRGVAEITMDPMNAITGGMGALKTVAKGFMKAGLPLFGPRTMLGMRGFFGIEDAEDIHDHYQQKGKARPPVTTGEIIDAKARMSRANIGAKQ